MMVMFTSVKLETSDGGTIGYIDHCHSSLFIQKLLNSTDDEYRSDSITSYFQRDYLQRFI